MDGREKFILDFLIHQDWKTAVNNETRMVYAAGKLADAVDAQYPGLFNEVTNEAMGEKIALTGKQERGGGR